MQLEFQWFRRDPPCRKRVEAELGVRGRCEVVTWGSWELALLMWSILCNSQVEAALPKAQELWEAALSAAEAGPFLEGSLKRQQKPYPPKVGLSSTTPAWFSSLFSLQNTLRYFVYLLVYVTTAFFRRRRPCPSYSFLENGKSLEQNSHSVNIAK